MRAMAPAPGEQLAQISLAVLFAAGGFGRRTAEIWVGEQIVEQCGKQAAARSHLRVAIVGAAAAGEMAHETRR